MEIIHWDITAIDQTLIDHMMDNKLHCKPTKNKISGLLKIYTRHKRLGVHFLRHVWIAYVNDDPVGVAMLEDNSRSLSPETLILQMYVKLSYRNKGIGCQLIQRAIATEETFGVRDTPLASRLYAQFDLVDMRGGYWHD